MAKTLREIRNFVQLIENEAFPHIKALRGTPMWETLNALNRLLDGDATPRVPSAPPSLPTDAPPRPQVPPQKPTEPPETPTQRRARLLADAEERGGKKKHGVTEALAKQEGVSRSRMQQLLREASEQKKRGPTLGEQLLRSVGKR